MIETTSLIMGLLLGTAISYTIFHIVNKTKSVSKSEFDQLTLKYNSNMTTLKLSEHTVQIIQSSNDELANKLSLKENQIIQLQTRSTSLEVQLANSEIKSNELTKKLTVELTTQNQQQAEINFLKQKNVELVARNNTIVENLSYQNDKNTKQTKHIEELGKKLTFLTAEVTKLTTNNNYLSEKLTHQKTEVENLQKTAHLQFEKIANKLLEEKSYRFTETNKANIETLLNPLKEDINRFKTKVEQTHEEDTKQRVSLEERIRGLVEQTNKVSTEANNLATALKGKPQKRGNWGEMILERILESSGLTKDREYSIQKSIKDEEGKHLRPDIQVNLPDERVIIIDSKVSLIAYDKFSASDDVDEQKIALHEHIKATQEHIDQLSAKKYDDIESSLDFTMMFVPIEPAYLLALQGNPDLWAYAYSKRILLVSPTNLIACLKLISDLWKREWQNKNAMDIVKKGEILYDKFVNFSKTFEEIGYSLKSSQEKYDKALGQLKTGRGNMINQAVQLRNLGLKSDKKFPNKLMPQASDDESDGGEELI